VGRVLRAVATWTDGHGTVETAFAETGVVAARVITLPPPEGGKGEGDSAADEWTSADLAGMIADGGSFSPPAGVGSVRLADGVLCFGASTAEAFLARLYLGLLGREGDVEGLAFAAEALENGASRADVARAILSSAEYGARHGAPRTDAGFVEDLYTAFLGRAGDASEHGFWTAALGGGLSRAEVAAAIAASGESGSHIQGSTTGVFVADSEGIQARSLYKCALGREADAPGLLHWSKLIERGFDARTLGGFFEGSAEFGAPRRVLGRGVRRKPVPERRRPRGGRGRARLLGGPPRLGRDGAGRGRPALRHDAGGPERAWTGALKPALAEKGGRASARPFPAPARPARRATPRRAPCARPGARPAGWPAPRW
jgi:hypothetical protein